MTSQIRSSLFRRRSNAEPRSDLRQIQQLRSSQSSDRFISSLLPTSPWSLVTLRNAFLLLDGLKRPCCKHMSTRLVRRTSSPSKTEIDGLEVRRTGQSNPRQPFGRIAETVEFQAAPLHQAEEQAAHTTVGRIEVVECAATAELAACTAEQHHRQLL